MKGAVVEDANDATFPPLAGEEGFPAPCFAWGTEGCDRAPELVGEEAEEGVPAKAVEGGVTSANADDGDEVASVPPTRHGFQ